jgi:predicted nucleic acid-binding protein
MPKMISNTSCLIILDNINKQLQLKFTGVLGILLKAKQQRIIDSVAEILTQLKIVNFRVSEKLEKKVLKLAGES